MNLPTWTPDAIAALRHRLGLTQRGFCARYHLSLDALRNWEQGRTCPEQAVHVLLHLIDFNPDHAAAALAWLAHQRVTLRRVPRPPGADDSLLEEPSESSSEAARQHIEATFENPGHKDCYCGGWTDHTGDFHNLGCPESATQAATTASADNAEFLSTLQGAAKEATDEWIAGFVRQHFGIYGQAAAGKP